MRITALKGHEELRRALERDLHRATVSHATLFTGPAGSGKKSWGKALALALLCSNSRGIEPCGECLDCRQFLSGNHPRFFTLKPLSSRLKVEQIREVRSLFYLEGGNRVCLIEEAERMTDAACSSLLKILEEPPPDLYFILLAEHPRRLFSTIVSRCRRFTLNPLDHETIMGIFSETPDLSPSRAAVVSRLSGGLPGTALELAGDNLLEERYRDAASLVFHFRSGHSRPHELLDRAAALAEREDLLSFLEALHHFLRDGLVWNLCGSKKLLANPEHACAWEEKIAFRNIEDAIEIVNAIITEIRDTNVNRRLAMERMLIILRRRLSR